MKDSLEI